VVDDAPEVRDPALFLWTVFTPSIRLGLSRKNHVRNNKIEYSVLHHRLPISLVSGEIIPDRNSRKVNERWSEYFA
jgi:hypothetical protein